MIKFVPSKATHTSRIFRFAHISDPHLSNLDNIAWRQLCNKRILGYLSWRFSRRFIHRLDILNALINDIDQAKVNHLVISGDLTHIGTATECEQVSLWLKGLGTASDISVIPGNHDNYTPNDPAQTTDQWLSYMSGDVQSNQEANSKTIFPSFRQRDSLAIIGLSTALPTAPFFATGRLGQEQIDKLAELLKQTGEKGLFRIVMLHHGPLAETNKFRKRLIDAAQFRSVIKSHGAELILHGHGHEPVNGLLQTPYSKIPVIGVASASLLSSSINKRAGYNIYEVKQAASHWRLKILSRSYETENAVFKTREEMEFTLPIA